MVVGLCAVAHHFMPPAIAASIQKADYDEMLEQEDFEGIARLARIVRILTLQGTAFSVLWYLVGLGLSSLFQKMVHDLGLDGFSEAALKA